MNQEADCIWRNRFRLARCWSTVWALATWATSFCATASTSVEDGLIIVVMAINRDDQRLVSGPDIISRGFIYVRENEDIIENTRDVVRQILSQSSLAGEDWPALKNRMQG